MTHQVRLECDPDIPVAPGEEHYPSEPILQISVIIPNNPALILKGRALQDKAKAGIINQTKALWKSVKQLFYQANMPVVVRTSSPTQMAYLIIHLTKTANPLVSSGNDIS